MRGATWLKHRGADKNLLPELSGQIRSFVPPFPAPRQINRLDWTKTHGKTFVVLAGFCHIEA